MKLSDFVDRNISTDVPFEPANETFLDLSHLLGRTESGADSGRLVVWTMSKSAPELATVEGDVESGVVLSGVKIEESSLGYLLARLDDQSLQIDDFATFSYVHIKFALFVRHTKKPARLANELVLRTLLQRELEPQLRQLRSTVSRLRRAEAARGQQLSPAAAIVADYASESARAEQRRRDAESERKRVLDETARLRRRVGELEVELDKLRHSTGAQLGQVASKVLRQPRQNLPGLPKALARVARSRGTWKPPQAQGGGGSDSAKLVDQQLFHSFRDVVPADDGPVVAGVFSRSSAAALRGDFGSVPLWPNDALAIFDLVDPDLLLIQSSATDPGEAWSTLGQPAGLRLDELLRQTIQAARSAGVPIVFFVDRPFERAPGLRSIAHLCDFVCVDASSVSGIDGWPLTFGVSLEQFAVGLPTRDDRPVQWRNLSHTDPLGDHVIAELLPSGGVELLTSVATMRGTYLPGSRIVQRLVRSPFAVAATFTAKFQQIQPLDVASALACGVPVIGTAKSAPNDWPVIRLNRVEELAGCVEEAGDQDPRLLKTMGLRLALELSPTSQMDALFDQLGIGAPRRRRPEIVVPGGTDPQQAIRDLSRIDASRHRIFLPDDWTAGAVEEIRELGFEISAERPGNTARRIEYDHDVVWDDQRLIDLDIASRVYSGGSVEARGFPRLIGANVPITPDWLTEGAYS